MYDYWKNGSGDNLPLDSEEHVILSSDQSKYIFSDYTINWIQTTVGNVKYCISSGGEVGGDALLVKCVEDDDTLKWYIPSYNGYWYGKWVSLYDASLCLNINNDNNEVKIVLCEESTDNINITGSESIT